MSAFTDPDEWCERHAGTYYKTTQPLIWELGYVGSGQFHTVPAGEVFDVSFPWFSRWLLSPHNPRYLKAAALHDHMLIMGWDRPTAGGVFHAALKVEGVRAPVRMAMFFAVTLWK